MDADRGEEDGQHDCPAVAGGRTTGIAGWVAQHTALSGCHRASPLRRRRQPLVLEDQLVLRQGFRQARAAARDDDEEDNDDDDNDDHVGTKEQ